MTTKDQSLSLVLKVPESLCSLMSGRSYHWWLSLSQNSDAGFPDKQEPVQPKWSKKKKKKKKKSKVSDTTFKVTLPLVQGSLLVRRMSFSGDDQLVSPAYLPPADAGLQTPPESEDFELDCYSNSDGFNYSENTVMDANSQFQPNDYSERADQDTEQKVDGCFSYMDCINRTEDLELIVYEERNAETQDCSSAYEVGHSAAQEKLNVKTALKQVWPPPNSYQCGSGYTNHWYSSPQHSEVGAKSMMEMSSEVAQHHQPFQNQDMVQDHPSQFTANMGHHFMSGGLAPNYVTMKRHPHFGYVGHSSAHCSSVTSEQEQFPHIDQTRLHTYGYMPLYFGHAQTHSMAYQRVTYDPNCNTHYGTTPQSQQY